MDWVTDISCKTAEKRAAEFQRRGVKWRKNTDGTCELVNAPYWLRVRYGGQF